MSEIADLSVRIVRFVNEEPQPGIVACELMDAGGCRHTIVDKVPCFTGAWLWHDSVYPQSAWIRCEVLERWKDESGRELVRISTARPFAIETTNGQSEFVVTSGSLESV